MNDVDLAYLAGLFDGEGSAGVYIINHHRKRQTKKKGIIDEVYRHALPVVQIRMLDEGPIAAFQAAFPGWKGTSKPAENQRGPIHEWRRNHRHALEVAVALMPFSRNESKKAQFQKIIDHYATLKPPKKGEKRYGGAVLVG